MTVQDAVLLTLVTFAGRVDSVNSAILVSYNFKCYSLHMF